MRTALKAGFALALGLTLLTLTGPVNLAQGSGLEIQSYLAVANTVVVTVSNPEQIATPGQLQVRARMGVLTTTKTVSLNVHAGEVTVAVVAFPLPVSEVIVVGITDASDPF